MMGLLAAGLCATVDSSLLALQPGDTIAIVGGAQAERMQHFPYFEAILRGSLPGVDLHVRNFAWSGDEVALQPRPYKFAGMDAHFDRVETDVLIGVFGMNESFAGEGGLRRFQADLDAWFDRNSRFRIVLISPTALETLGGRLPDGECRNFEIARYVEVMRSAALRRGIPFVDLFRPTRRAMRGESDLTINGMHLNDSGYRLAARALAAQLGIDASGIDVTSERIEAIREKNRLAFERFRPINTEYVYGRRHNPFGNDNFPAEMERLEALARAADGSLLRGEPVSGALFAEDDLPVPAVAAIDPKATSISAEDRLVPPPGLQVGNFELPPGWSINCFASEETFPMLANPIAMNFDGAGRLWVAVSPTYPHVVPGDQPADKLIVLEDTDRDGVANACTVFADGLYIPTGFATNGDEAWVVSQPNLLHVVDTDGDGKSDRRDIVLHGFGAEDSHHAMSAFARPPDGSIYFQEGTFHHTQIESPGGPVRAADAAVFRYDPDTAEVEVASSWPWANPWGHVVDRWGRSIITDGTSGTSRRLTHIAGAHAYPDTHKGDPEIRGVPSFTPGSRRPAGGTQILGGTHLPPATHGRLVLPQNIGFHGLHWYALRGSGSGFVATPVEPDLLRSTDPTCRPVDVEVGPDGAIYMLDWANPIVGHMQFSVRDPRRDHTHGRVWRITKDERPLGTWSDIGQLECGDILTLLEGNDPWAIRRGRIELQGRPPAEVLPQAVAWAEVSGNAHDLMEALWLHQAHGVVNEPLLDRVLTHDEPDARAAAVSVLRSWRDDVAVYDRLKRAVLDSDPGVRLEAILALGFLQDPRSIELLSLAMRQPMDAGMTAVLARSTTALEPWGMPGGPGTDAWGLSRLSDSRLLDEPMGYFSAAEVMRRSSLGESAVRSAAEWLASASGRGLVDEVWDGVREAPSGGAADLLVTLHADVLKPIRTHMTTVATDRGQPERLRQTACAGLIRVDGWLGAWHEAAADYGDSQRVDVLDATARWPMLADTSSREVMIGYLRGGPPPTCEPVCGRFVRVELDGAATLTLAEVEVMSGGSNVSLGQPCSQSTTNWDGVADRAVDGDSNGIWTAGTSTHTIEGQMNPWWEVDLGVVRPIDQVVLHNRIDRPHDRRLDGFRLVVLDADRAVVWQQEGNPAPQFHSVVVPGGDSDRLVRQAAMDAIASVSPKAQTLALLEPWVVRGDSDTRMRAATAMSRIPEDVWPDDLQDLQLKRVRVSTVPHKMSYDVTKFEVAAGQPVEIELVNEDQMPHNLVVGKPGSLRRIGRAADAQGTSGEAVARQYIPDVRGILHTSPLVMEGDTGFIRFIAPERPGRYPYVCTYPGHWQLMNGVMTVR
ncbi:MAG: HEAT repeat domain-containing protein [Phycisphaerales bacterium]|jgi:putative membrane-bound dehydrogenase-like protein|nr:HEAT repeat domain-containing protein [Phycisphaerales bacterium]